MGKLDIIGGNKGIVYTFDLFSVFINDLHPNLDKPPNSCTTGQAEPNRWSCKTYGVFLFWFVQVSQQNF